MVKCQTLFQNLLDPEVVNIQKTLFIFVLRVLWRSKVEKYYLGTKDKSYDCQLLPWNTNMWELATQHVLIFHRHCAVSESTQKKTVPTGTHRATYDFSLFQELLRRFGELILQKKGINAFIKIAGHWALRRHLHHAPSGKKKTCACACEDSSLKKRWSTSTQIIKAEGMLYHLQIICYCRYFSIFFC